VSLPMLAHIEEVSHAHPHPAGMPWELIALLAVAAVVSIALVAGLYLRR